MRRWESRSSLKRRVRVLEREKRENAKHQHALSRSRRLGLSVPLEDAVVAFLAVVDRNYSVGEYDAALLTVRDSLAGVGIPKHPRRHRILV